MFAYVWEYVWVRAQKMRNVECRNGNWILTFSVVSWNLESMQICTQCERIFQCTVKRYQTQHSIAEKKTDKNNNNNNKKCTEFSVWWQRKGELFYTVFGIHFQTLTTFIWLMSFSVSICKYYIHSSKWQMFNCFSKPWAFFARFVYIYLYKSHTEKKAKLIYINVAFGLFGFIAWKKGNDT